MIFWQDRDAQAIRESTQGSLGCTRHPKSRTGAIPLTSACFRRSSMRSGPVTESAYPGKFSTSDVSCSCSSPDARVPAARGKESICGVLNVQTGDAFVYNAPVSPRLMRGHPTVAPRGTGRVLTSARAAMMPSLLLSPQRSPKLLSAACYPAYRSPGTSRAVDMASLRQDPASADEVA